MGCIRKLWVRISGDCSVCGTWEKEMIGGCEPLWGAYTACKKCYYKEG